MSRRDVRGSAGRQGGRLPSSQWVLALSLSIAVVGAGYAWWWVGAARTVASPVPGPGQASDALVRWRAGAAAPFASGRDGTLVWTGSELVVWGGRRSRGSQERTTPTNEGFAYRPAEDRWRALPFPPLTPRTGSGGTWTGSEVLIWGGRGRFGLHADGAAYDPAADEWRALPPAPLSPREEPALVHVGDEVVGGGRNGTGTLAHMAAYDPTTNAWHAAGGLPLTRGQRPGTPAPKVRRLGDHLLARSFDDHHPLRITRGGVGGWKLLPPLPKPEPHAIEHLAVTSRGIVAVPQSDGTPRHLVPLLLEGRAWRPLPNPPLGPAASVVAASTARHVYVITDTGAAAVFDVVSDRWQPLPEVGVPVPGPARLFVAQDRPLLWTSAGDNPAPRPLMLLLPAVR